MGESVFNLQVPIQLLHCLVSEHQQRLKDIQALGHVRAHEPVYRPTCFNYPFLPSPPLPSPPLPSSSLPPPSFLIQLGKDWDKTIDQFKQLLRGRIADYQKSIKSLSDMLLDGTWVGLHVM